MNLEFNTSIGGIIAEEIKVTKKGIHFFMLTDGSKDINIAMGPNETTFKDSDNTGVTKNYACDVNHRVGLEYDVSTGDYKIYHHNGTVQETELTGTLTLSGDCYFIHSGMDGLAEKDGFTISYTSGAKDSGGTTI